MKARSRLTRVLLVAAAVGAGAYLVHTISGWQDRSAERRDALAEARMGSREKAIPALQRCLERDPDDAEVLAVLVGAMTAAGKPNAEVEPYLDRWCKLRPDDP